LSVANHVLIYDLTENTSQFLQMISRADREGQTRQTYVHNFIVPGMPKENLLQLAAQNKQIKASNNLPPMISLYENSRQMTRPQLRSALLCMLGRKQSSKMQQMAQTRHRAKEPRRQTTPASKAQTLVTSRAKTKQRMPDGDGDGDGNGDGDAGLKTERAKRRKGNDTTCFFGDAVDHDADDTNDDDSVTFCLFDEESTRWSGEVSGDADACATSVFRVTCQQHGRLKETWTVNRDGWICVQGTSELLATVHENARRTREPKRKRRRVMPTSFSL
jgi:hypothetical protein